MKVGDKFVIEIAETFGQNSYKIKGLNSVYSKDTMDKLEPFDETTAFTNGLAALRDMDTDTISRRSAIDIALQYCPDDDGVCSKAGHDPREMPNEIEQLPPSQPTQLTNDDIETIRVHLSAIKEDLCNQHRWNEAKEYEALIDRLTAQSEQTSCEYCHEDIDGYVTPKQRTGHWIPVGMVEAVGGESAQWGSAIVYHKCSECDEQALRDDFEHEVLSEWCPHCGAKMEGVGE